jgi:hypothetical protein
MSDQYSPSGTTGGIPAYNEPMLIAEPPGWPKVVGIISIVWGGLAILCTGCGIAGLATQSWAMGQAQQSGQKVPQIPAVMMPGNVDYALMGVGAIWAVVLIFAGIACVKRSPSARMLHLVYAIGGLAMTLGATVWNLQKQAAIAQYFKDNPNDPMAQYNSPMGAMIGMGLGLVIGGAWPVFTLIWFGFVKTKPEQMHGGQDAGVA